MLGEAGYAYRKVLQILRCHPEVPWLRAEVAISQAEEGSGWEDPARHALRNSERPCFPLLIASYHLFRP